VARRRDEAISEDTARSVNAASRDEARRSATNF